MHIPTFGNLGVVMDWVKMLKGAAVGGIALGAGYGITKVLRKKKEPPPGLARSLPVINGLDPTLQTMAKRVLQKAHNIGIPLVVTQGVRSMAEQQRLYDQGRVTAGPIVTHAVPGNSWHNYGLAFDVAVLKDGQPTWPNDLELWDRIGVVGKSVGLSWGGDFPTGQIDRPHFDYHPAITIADARQGVRPGGRVV